MLLWLLTLISQALGFACNAANGGSNSINGVAQLQLNAGWFYSVATYLFDASPTYFKYSHTTNEPFLFTLVDAFCPGDSYFIFIISPLGNNYFLGSLGPDFIVVCGSPKDTTDPNVAFADHLFFSYRTLSFDFATYGNLIGTWTFEVKLAATCSVGPFNSVGFYARVDSARFTNTACAFSSSSITSYSLSPLPPPPNFNKVN